MPQAVPTRLRRFLLEEDGPTITEYAVLVAAVALTVIVIVEAIGQSTNDWLTTASESY